jgi:hypothetical protein
MYHWMGRYGKLMLSDALRAGWEGIRSLNSTDDIFETLGLRPAQATVGNAASLAFSARCLSRIDAFDF